MSVNLTGSGARSSSRVIRLRLAKSRQTGLSEAELIRRALRSALLTDDRGSSPGFVALGASKPATAKLDKKAMRKRWAEQLESKGK